MEIIKFKKVQSFNDPIYNTRYYVAVLHSKKLKKELLKENNWLEFEAAYDNNQRLFIFKEDVTPDIIAHECWHAIDCVLLDGRGVTIDESSHNEHIAYYIQCLVKEIILSLYEIEQGNCIKITKKLN